MLNCRLFGKKKKLKVNVNYWYYYIGIKNLCDRNGRAYIIDAI